ncbi:MAG: hypothetical protein AAGF12_16230 [Myxococcota bacterium]
MTAVILGGLTLLLFVIHVTAGERGVAKPMLAADFSPTARWTMYVCWHAVSAQLFLGGVALIWAGLVPGEGATLVVRAVSTLALAYAVLFLIIATRLERGWLKLGQWMAFLPLGVVGWASTLM